MQLYYLNMQQVILIVHAYDRQVMLHFILE
jgi:hypothetical protein